MDQGPARDGGLKRGRRRPHLLLATAGTTSLLFAALIAGSTWYYSDELWTGAFAVDHTPAQPDVRILDVSSDTIRLGPLPGTDKNGAWAEDGVVGLEFKDGYAQLGAVLDRHPTSVLRQLHVLRGQPATGMTARANTYYYTGDPKSALGLDFSDVPIPSPGGPLPAWFVPASGSTWIVFVHGKGSNREEGLRLLSSTHELGYPFLAISYRNDRGAPAAPSYGYGATEWQDLDAAVAYAKAQGAADVVLAGSSMGGAIVLSFMAHSPDAGFARSLILNAPVIDFGDTISYAAERRSLPPLLADSAEWLTSLRHGVDWKAVDFRSVAAILKVPVLLMHGDADQTVPVSASDAFAESRPDLVTYDRVPGAGHVRAWNRDPAAFQAAMAEFLERMPAIAASP